MFLLLLMSYWNVLLLLMNIYTAEPANSNNLKFSIIQNNFDVPNEIYVCILTLNYSKSQ